MCGRFFLTSPPDAVAEMFDYDARPNFPPRHNIAPTQPVLVVTADAAGRRSPQLMRWGFLPAWVKDPKGFPLLINARSEEAARKPAFRAAMRHRRCLIPANGFYEWQRAANGKKQPFAVRPVDDGPVAFAGVWESYAHPEGGEMDTAAILTTDACATLAPIHERMPVILGKSDFARWLDIGGTGAEELRDLFRSPADDTVRAYPVSTRVNRVANDDAGLLDPLACDATPPPDDRPADRRRQKPTSDDQLSLF